MVGNPQSNLAENISEGDFWGSGWALTEAGQLDRIRWTLRQPTNSSVADQSRPRERARRGEAAVVAGAEGSLELQTAL